MIRIIDNIPQSIVADVEKWVTGTKIPWYHFDDTLGKDMKGSYTVEQNLYTIVDMPRFTHYFFPNSSTPKDDGQWVAPLTRWCVANIPELSGKKVKRAMGNLTTPLAGSADLLNVPHVDYSGDDFFSFLYYVNDSDGKTVFFDNGEVIFTATPIRGTGVLFNSNTVHAGQVPSINKARYVINVIFG